MGHHHQGRVTSPGVRLDQADGARGIVVVQAGRGFVSKQQRGPVNQGAGNRDALCLALAIRHPERVQRLVLMGAVGVRFQITPALDAVWGYEPSFENMRKLMDLFAFNRNLVNDELAMLRSRASIRPGFQESFAAMFPAPRQRWVDAMASPEEDIRRVDVETLIVHGRDDQVIPLSNAYKFMELLPRAQMHVFGRCGHWTQIEHADRFNRLLLDFFGEADAD